MSKTTAQDEMYLEKNKRIHRSTCKRTGTWKGGPMGVMTYGAAAARIANGGATPAACCKPKIDPADAPAVVLEADAAASDPCAGKPHKAAKGKGYTAQPENADPEHLALCKAAGRHLSAKDAADLARTMKAEAAAEQAVEAPTAESEAAAIAEHRAAGTTEHVTLAESKPTRRGVRATSAAGQALEQGEPEKVDKDVRVKVDGRPVTVHYLERVRVPGQRRVVKATWTTEDGKTIVLEGTVYAVDGTPTDARTLTDAVKVAIG